jgi:hypothetical protein
VTVADLFHSTDRREAVCPSACVAPSTAQISLDPETRRRLRAATPDQVRNPHSGIAGREHLIDGRDPGRDGMIARNGSTAGERCTWPFQQTCLPNRTLPLTRSPIWARCGGGQAYGRAAAGRYQPEGERSRASGVQRTHGVATDRLYQHTAWWHLLWLNS